MTDNNKQIRDWVQGQQGTLDEIVAAACRKFWEDNKAIPNFAHDLKCSQREAWNLSKGKDLCYDRITTPLSYALWYHPRRVNTFLSFFIDHLIGFSGRSVHFFDLGAGTGAVQQAIMLVVAGMREHGMSPPSITITNIDTSPFMLYFNRDYLWKNFAEQYGIDQSWAIKQDYEVNSWSNPRPSEGVDSIVAASYLFDASENVADITASFMELKREYEPTTLLLSTSNRKKGSLDELANALGEDYTTDGNASGGLLFSGSLQAVNRLRGEIKEAYPSADLSRNASWNDPSYYGVAFTKSQKGLDLPPPKAFEKIDLHAPPITVISDIELNEKQRAAAAFSKAPSVITGPAGCGKSVVIAEKICNTAKEADGGGYNPQMEILVTTFNTSLVSLLNTWVIQLLGNNADRTNENRGAYGICFQGAAKQNITIMNFDKLPTRIGGIRYRNMQFNESFHEQLMEGFANEVRREKGIPNDQYTDILDPQFLWEEYHRVVYGLNVDISDGNSDYLRVQRKGRGNNPSLAKTDRRSLVLDVLRKYQKHVVKNGIGSLPEARRAFLKSLRGFSKSRKYDYLFVDEFQDCTLADFEIFNQLLKAPDNLCLAGDLAQAIQIGKSAKIPKFEDMARRKWHPLEGSYRLPARVSEAIKPISEAIRLSFGTEEGGVGIATPYKGAPPGARPIVVHASETCEMAAKVEGIINHYRAYWPDSSVGGTQANQITIMEKDHELRKALGKRQLKDAFGNAISVETDTILRLKGLEKRCVIWSTRIGIENEKEVYELIYTILSRTSSILIIALSDSILDIYKPLIGRLDKDRLIFWDSETEERFDSLRKEKAITPSIDE